MNTTHTQDATASTFTRASRPILITGVSGFIAGHLAERLLAEGAPIHGTVRRPQTTKAEQAHTGRLQVLQADLADAAALRRAATGCAAVVHAAAWTGGADLSPEAGYRVNVAGTANVLAAAQAAGVDRFIYLSSVAVYGVNRSPIVDETAATPAVEQAYPDSKIAAERLVRESGLPYVIIRPASTYGPRGGAWTIGPVQNIKAGRLLLLGADRGLVTPGYIDNVVDGLLLALAHPAAAGETFNLCDDQAVTYREFYLAYARMLGRDRLPTVPGWVAALARSAPASRARRIMGRAAVGPWSLHFRRNPSQFSVAKAQRLLGYAPRIDFSEGMRRTEAWLRAGGPSALKMAPQPPDFGGSQIPPRIGGAGGRLHPQGPWRRAQHEKLRLYSFWRERGRSCHAGCPIPLPPSPPGGEGGVAIWGVLGGCAAQNTPSNTPSLCRGGGRGRGLSQRFSFSIVPRPRPEPPI